MRIGTVDITTTAISGGQFVLNPPEVTNEKRPSGSAGGIWTYSVAGAQFGYSLLWAMIPTTIALVVVQEMASRMGAVTGKGLSDLIREEFGFRVTFFLMLALVVTNFGNVMAEFAGVASSLELFGISRYIVVPIAAALVWVLVVHGTYNSVEKIFLVGVGLLRLLHRCRNAGASRLEGRGVRDRHPAAGCRDRATTATSTC